MADFMDYPTPKRKVGGCRISSYYYDKHEDAIAASKAAEHNARVGNYDVGFVPPGEMRFVSDLNEWEVAVV